MSRQLLACKASTPIQSQTLQVRTFDETIAALRSGPWDILLLSEIDGGKPQDIVKWLQENSWYSPATIIYVNLPDL